MQGIRVYCVVCAAICQGFFPGSLDFAADARAVELESSTISFKNALITNSLNTTNSSNTANATNTTNLSQITVALKSEGGPGLVTTTRAYITVGTNKFAFLVPDEFKMAGCDAQKVTLMKGDGSCLINVRVIGSKPPSDKPFDCAAARGLIYEEHRDATVVSEFAMFAGGVGGPAFEINWGIGALSRVSRVGFIPLRAGLVEFSVDSSAKNLGPSLGDFNYLLLTFRASDENGKLAATPISDQI
jgi:hypothetical protein